MRYIALTITLMGALVLASVALGYGDPPHTVKAPDFPACSVTAYGPTFSSNLQSFRYGGGTSCKGGIGLRALTIWAQVRGAQGKWWTIQGSENSVGSATGYSPAVSTNPVRKFASRPALLGHVYRTEAEAHLTVPNGFAGCSLHHPPACDEHITVIAYSAPIAP